MKIEELKDRLLEMDMEDTIFFENPSYVDAIIGISDDDRLIYDYDKMVNFLVEKDGMEEDEAIEFIDYNTLRALPYMGNKAPIVNLPFNF